MLGEASTIQPTDPTRLSLPFTNDGDAAQSGDIGDSEETWIEATVAGSGTVTFDYQVSADSGDNFTFYIDGSYTFGRSGSKSWAASGPWTVSGSGTHKLRWRFSKDSSGSSGDDCAWVDHIRWTGDAPESGANWSQIEYTYDPSGRRIAKDVDGVVTKYLYDGSHCIAEYDANDVLLRKYIYGPGVDQPICMIDVADANAAYYYHYDALGSVVALSDSAGDTVQVYDYDVYGQVASYPPDDTNPFLFTGRRYDTETGLYYYRARYYNPTIGRFLQTDPIGYEGGMNLYRYCSNNPWNMVDPFGLKPSVYVRDSNDPNRWIDDPEPDCSATEAALKDAGYEKDQAEEAFAQAEHLMNEAEVAMDRAVWEAEVATATAVALIIVARFACRGFFRKLTAPCILATGAALAAVATAAILTYAMKGAAEAYQAAVYGYSMAARALIRARDAYIAAVHAHYSCTNSGYKH